MSDSILDKVLTRRDAVEKQSFDAALIVAQLLQLIPEKESQVLQKRFGLLNSEKQTLEVIGKEFQVTRERIRQIERQGINNIQSHDSFREIMKPVEHVVTGALLEHGGVMTMDLVAQELLVHNHKDAQYRASLFFILSQLLQEKVELVRARDLFEMGWKLRSASVDMIEEGVKELTKVVEAAGKPLSFDELHDAFKATDLYEKNAEHFTESVILSYLHIAAAIGKNPFEEFGLAHWGQVQPKRMHDRVYLVLKKEGEPMHFADIASRITEIFGKKAYPPTVHNELILNEEYVLVGRGLYALKEWGYQEGVVSDIITAVLNDAGKALTRDEIVQGVLEQRVVKRNTIHLALTDKSRFTRQKDGRFVLTSSVIEAQVEAAEAAA